MRDLVFKNLTSSDKKRRVIASSETVDQHGIRSVIHRHFICILKEIKDKNIKKPVSEVYALKEQNHIGQRERFICRLKGSIVLENNGRYFLVLYMHSLKINLTSMQHPIINE